MIHRLIRIFNANGAEQIAIVANDLYPETAEYVRKLMSEPFGKHCRLVVKSTPSSMHSLYALSSLLEEGSFCLTTVDTIFREEEFARYIEDFSTTPYDGLMGVSDFIDDERPLYVETGEHLMISGFGDTATQDSKYISGGIYGLKPICLQTLQRCMAEGLHRMRNFQRGLIKDGRKLQAWPFSKVLDIDHASDILKAEQFLATDKAL